MTEQAALQEAYNKFGAGRIPLHRSDYTDQLSAEAVQTLKHLPYGFDDRGEIKYSVRRMDQVINLEVWR
jgi:hypothetical protein